MLWELGSKNYVARCISLYVFFRAFKKADDIISPIIGQGIMGASSRDN